MKKLIRLLCALLIVLTAALMSAVVYGFYCLPDEMFTVDDQPLDMGRLYSYSFTQEEGERASKSVVTEGEYEIRLSLFNKIPVKNSSLTVGQRHYVVPSGEIIGLRLFTKGVMIVGIDSVDGQSGSVNPGEKAGLVKGDVIVKIGGKEVVSSAQVDSVVLESEGSSLEVEYIRNEESRSCVLTPVFSKSTGRYKTGLWIRDSAAGIGTMTFYEPNTGFFACLGHAVCDVDTGFILPFSGGDIVDAEISDCVKGKAGSAGELCGVFRKESEGTLLINNSCGAFGYLSMPDRSKNALAVATESEIEEGYAQIISTVEGDTPQYYDIEIEKLSFEREDGKNMTVKITDEKLLAKTGGIVQGMSGSPIIQNGRLIGAVTHVLVGDPTRGYGILAQNMIFAAQSVIESTTEKAS